MDILLLVVLLILVVFFSFTLIRSWFLQRRFNKTLNLNSAKNNTVLLKQISGLSLSIIVFVLVLNNTSYLVPKMDTASPNLVTSEDVREAMNEYNVKAQDNMFDVDSEEITVIGEVALENNHLYVLVLIDDVYYLMDKTTDKIVEVLPMP